MEFFKDRNIIYPLRLKEEFVNELHKHLILCYVGKKHYSGDFKAQRGRLEGTLNEVEDRINGLKKNALEIRDCLLSGSIDRIGVLLGEAWDKKKHIDPEISNSKIDELYDTGLRNGAYGGKLLGAGGGGYILFFYSPKKKGQIVKALEERGGEIMSFNFDFNGTRTWTTNLKL